LSSDGTSSIPDWDGVVVEDVVHNIILVGTVVSRAWGVGGSGGWVLLLLLSISVDSNYWLGGDHKCSNGEQTSELHLSK
jgi:hypothetical protein